MISKIDSKGRVYIPIEELEKIGKSLPEKSIEELKREILKQALEELQ
ncbi:MAG: hypothetical protein PWQ92_225 [Thermococcaceae archaeon]|nr:hypothetical protein [Thermococcaceae archaeon]